MLLKTEKEAAKDVTLLFTVTDTMACSTAGQDLRHIVWKPSSYNRTYCMQYFRTGLCPHCMETKLIRATIFTSSKPQTEFNQRLRMMYI